VSAAYYKPSHKVPILGLVVTLIGGVIVSGLLFVPYAAVLVYNPSAYLGIVLPALFGGAIGGLVAAIGRRMKIRNPWALALAGVAFAMGSYVLSWVPWEWFTLSHLGQEVDVRAVLYPITFLEILQLLYENGAWTIGSSGGAVSGAMLGLVWLCEAGLIVGSSGFVAFALASSGVFCETCEKWCTSVASVFTHSVGAQGQISNELERRNLAVLTSAPRPEPTDGMWLETALAYCECGATNTLLVESCTRKVDRRGNATVQRQPVVKHLLIARDEAQWVRRSSGR